MFDIHIERRTKTFHYKLASDFEVVGWLEAPALSEGPWTFESGNPHKLVSAAKSPGVETDDDSASNFQLQV